MKTALKVLGGIVATIILAFVIFYVGWMMPPSPNKVCDNIEKITVAHAKSEGLDIPTKLVEEAHEDCMEYASKEPRRASLFWPWIADLKCRRDAETMADLEACDDALDAAR